MDLMQALILGVVEGISEFLPISSTGHLILASEILGIPASEFVKSFEIAIQLGAILAVVVLYGRSLLLDFKILQRVAVAFVPTAILGLIFYKLIKKFLLGNSMVVVWALFIGGIILIVFELWHREKEDVNEDLRTIPFKTAFFIGVFQSFAMVPGVSRSAATIIGGLMLGLKRRTIVEFSFLLAIPTMTAAAGLDLLKSGHDFSSHQIACLGVGFGVSFIVALLSIKFLLHFIKNNNFISFGIYRIVVAVLFYFLLIRA
ncbi:MAG: undecaprenyl-diphosphate phosphatase [Candidatus Omnitrophica bacterium]|nr:undecaprenyl-diphosphate phosphatase [Candidatus Omnitrophota bacterium]